MTVRSANEALCDYCEELLGSVSVETIAGHRFHADCYDKWRKDVAVEQGLTSVGERPWGMGGKASA